MMRCLLIGSLFLTALTDAFGETIRVPGDYETIQLAIAAATSGDTIFVGVGMYAESLEIPAMHISIFGDVTPDTGEYERPIIDPSTLANPLYTRCAVISGGTVVFQDFVFRNGRQMYPRQGDNSGGIVSLADPLILRRCLMDSVYFPIRSLGVDCQLEQCEIRDATGRTIDTDSGRLVLTDSQVSGQSVWGLIECGANSHFQRSRVGGNRADGFLILASGEGHVYEECVFDHFGPTVDPVIWGDLHGSLISHCVFEYCTTGSSLIMSAHCDCGNPLRLLNNVFHYSGNAVGRGQGGHRVTVGCADSANCWILEATGNTFVDASVRVGTKGLSLHGQGLISGNRWERLQPAEWPALAVYAHGVACSENLFQDNGFAADADEDFGVSLNARNNWWGDSTGPRSVFNVNGLGDSAGATVEIDPWYTDTSFFQENAVNPRRELPQEFALSVFPNPFNSTATIEITPVRAVIAEIAVFDLLGRKVATVLDGAVGLTTRFSFDAANFSSGVYFVRAWDILGRKSLATEKIVLLK